MHLSKTSQTKRSICLARLVMTTIVLAGTASSERLPIKVYTTVDGLPRDHINRVVQDSKGFLWFCTSEGLSRFDGYKFSNYTTDQGLPSRQVNDFLETRNGTYWVATDKGVCRLNTEALPPANGKIDPDSANRFLVLHPGEREESNWVSTIREDHAGTIWCGTGAGVFRLNQIDDQWVFQFVDIIIPADTVDKGLVRTIIEDSKGSLWIGAEAGVYRLRPDGRVERYSTDEGLPALGNGRALLEDREGRIWVGTA